MKIHVINTEAEGKLRMNTLQSFLNHLGHKNELEYRILIIFRSIRTIEILDILCYLKIKKETSHT